MRVTCPHCKQRFDVKHVAVLAEARRLAEAAKTGQVPTGADGNVLDPEDEQARRDRAAAIRARMGDGLPG